MAFASEPAPVTHAFVGDGAERLLFRLALCARILFGFIFFVNGLNWWWKILPYPSMYDPVLPHTPQFVQAMIDTGFVFDFIRVVELVAGFSLLTNCWVPLSLVIVFPVTLGIWAVDILMIATLRADVMGWALLLLNAFLLSAYFECYAPIFVFRGKPRSFSPQE